jgi:hypothetical protein
VAALFNVCFDGRFTQSSKKYAARKQHVCVRKTSIECFQIWRCAKFPQIAHMGKPPLKSTQVYQIQSIIAIYFANFLFGVAYFANSYRDI